MYTAHNTSKLTIQAPSLLGSLGLELDPDTKTNFVRVWIDKRHQTQCLIPGDLHVCVCVLTGECRVQSPWLPFLEGFNLPPSQEHLEALQDSEGLYNMPPQKPITAVGRPLENTSTKHPKFAGLSLLKQLCWH